MIECIAEKYSHLLFFSLLVEMFLFLLLNELFALKPAQRQPQSQEGHKMQELNPGKQAMLAAGVIIKSQKQRHESSIMQAISLYVLQRQGFGSFCSTSYQRFLMHEAQMDQAWKK